MSEADRTPITSEDPADDALIGYCEELIAVEKHWDERHPHDDLVPARVWDTWWYMRRAVQKQLVECIVASRATMMAGHQARARAVAAFYPEIGEQDDDARLVGALLRDLIASQAATDDP